MNKRDAKEILLLYRGTIDDSAMYAHEAEAYDRCTAPLRGRAGGERERLALHDVAPRVSEELPATKTLR